jgi:hypothetical protein
MFAVIYEHAGNCGVRARFPELSPTFRDRLIVKSRLTVSVPVIVRGQKSRPDFDSGSR